MPLGVVPILAQVFTVAVGDRAEVRWIANESDTYYEAEDSALVSATLEAGQTSVGIAYRPSVIISPLEQRSGGRTREAFFFHKVQADASIKWQSSRRTSWQATQQATYDRSNTGVQGLSGGSATPGAPPPGAVPPDGTAATGQQDLRSSSDTVEVVSERTALSIEQLFSRREKGIAFVAYSASTGVNQSQNEFPLIQGPQAGASYAYLLTRNDTLTTALDARYAFAATGERAFIASLTETWSHRFSRYASLGVGGGIAYVWFDPEDGPPQDDFFFTSGAGGQLGITYTYVTRVYKGRLELFIGAGYAPALDQSRLTGTGQARASVLTPDVRVSVFSGANWVRNRLTLYANLASVVSAEPEDPGALNAIGGSLGGIYDLGAGFAFEAGARGGWQTFDGEELLAPSVAIFAALSWGATVLREGSRSPAPTATPGAPTAPR
jgi:hypothetical protein